MQSAISQIPGVFPDQGAGVDPGGTHPDGVDPVIASVAVYPATENIEDVADATLESISEVDAYEFDTLGEYLPTSLPDGYHFGKANLYETTMKDGTRYYMLRVQYTTGNDTAQGNAEEEIAASMKNQEKPSVELLDIRGNAGEMPAFSFYYRYLAYLVLCVMCYVLGYILIAFDRGRISQRMRASAVPPRRQAGEGLLASGVLALVLWIFCTAAAFLLYGREIFESGCLGYLLLNSGAIVLVSVTIAYLIGTFVKNQEALSGIVNIVSLSMSFICGVFVDLDYLSSGVRKAAQFFPVYWYERVNNLVAE